MNPRIKRSEIVEITLSLKDFNLLYAMVNDLPEYVAIGSHDILVADEIKSDFPELWMDLEDLVGQPLEEPLMHWFHQDWTEYAGAK